MGSYLDFVMTLFFAFGVAFEVPIATIILVWMGVTTPESLKQKRPYVIVGTFVVGMFLTPPDVISQTLLALPMWLLFELGLFFSKGFVRQQEQQTESEPTEPLAYSAAGAGSGNREEADTPVGRELDPARDSQDPDRFVPLTDAEMEAELDAIEAEEEELTPADKLLQVQTHRDAGEVERARELLYEILEEGDADQRRVARNILAQLDQP
jgi:sec-independent protein translocase protein TatC